MNQVCVYRSYFIVPLKIPLRSYCERGHPKNRLLLYDHAHTGRVTAGSAADIIRIVPAGSAADIIRIIPTGSAADIIRIVPAGSAADIRTRPYKMDLAAAHVVHKQDIGFDKRKRPVETNGNRQVRRITLRAGRDYTKVNGASKSTMLFTRLVPKPTFCLP